MGRVIRRKKESVVTPNLSGILYQRSNAWQGQSVSFYQGDDAWNAQNGVYAPQKFGLYESYARLDFSATNPWITLENLNEFGNNNRFTDVNGGQIYPSDYCIDHLTGYAIINFILGLETWENALQDAIDFSVFGFNDWRIANIKEKSDIFNYSTQQMLNYSPLSAMQHSNFEWTPLTQSNNNLNAYCFNPINSSVAFRDKTTSARSIRIRTHYK